MSLQTNGFCQALTGFSESRRALPAVLVFAAALIGALFILRWNSDLNFDGEVFLSAAQKIGQGRFRESLSIYPLPLYPGLIALLHLLIPDWVIAGRLVCCGFMVLTILPLYLLTRECFDPSSAFFACVVFALLPETQLLSVSVLRDPGFFHFLMWAIHFGIRALQTGSSRHLLAAALLAFIAALFRLEGAIIYPLTLALLLGLACRPGARRRRYARLLGTWTGLLAGLGLVYLAVFGVREGLADKYNVFVNQSGDFFSFQNYHRIATQLQEVREATPRSIIGRHFADLASQLILPIYLFGTFQIFFGAIQAVNVPALAVGLSGFRRRAPHAFLLLLGASSFVVMFCYFVWHDLMLQRYMFLPALLFCPWIGLGTARILGFLGRRPRGQLLCAGFLLFMLLGAVTGFGKHFWKIEDLKSRAGSWVAAEAAFSGCRILFNDPVLAFHSGREISFGGEGETLVYRDIEDKRLAGIEAQALQGRFDVIALYLKPERRASLRPFEQYVMLKEFEDRDRTVLVFGWRAKFPASLN